MLIGFLIMNNKWCMCMHCKMSKFAPKFVFTEILIHCGCTLGKDTWGFFAMS